MEIRLAGGRSLTVYEGGDPTGAPVLFHHGTPSSGVPYEGHLRLAEELGIRFLSYDRAGYGKSTRDPGRSVSDVAADIEAVADALALDRFATWGVSGGGPHALACAALLRDRVASVATIASAGPSDADDLDFMAGMGPGNVAEFGLARQGEDALRPALEEEAAGLAGVDVAQMAETLRPHCTEVDYAIAAGELGPYLLQTFRSGTAHGVDGWVDDDLAFTRPWGFDIADIRTPVLLIQGRQDLMVPFEHGQWLARHVPGAEARLFEDEGHLTPFVSRAGELHEWLLAHL